MLTDHDKLKNFDLQSFLNDTAKHNIFRLKKEYGSLGPVLADQLLLYKKATLKLPFFAEKYCFFTKKSFEQSSSERAAIYKSSLFSGGKMLDLTGGLGTDDWSFSKSFKKIISIDKDPGLNELVKINFEKIDIKNVTRLDADAYEYIKADNSFDLVYIDADRRGSAKKAVTLDSSEPNVLLILDRLFELTSIVLLKLSPLIDIIYLCKTLPGIKDIHVVSIDNEVKETLTILQREHSGQTTVNAVDLIKDKPNRIFSSITGKQTKTEISDEGQYFYEPSGSLIKAGLVNEYAAANGLNTVSHNSVFVTGNEYVNDFIGRIFIVISRIEFSKSVIKKYLKDNSITKANVSCRNFPVKEDEIKKLFGLRDGGENYLFFTTGKDKQKLMYHCRKERISSNDSIVTG